MSKCKRNYGKSCTNHSLTSKYAGALEDARFTVYEEDREEKVTSVSTYDMQRQSKEDKLSSYDVSTSPGLHIELKNSYGETILTRTFLT